MNKEEIKKEKEWYEKEIIELTKLSIHNNSLNPIQSVHLVDYKKNYLYLKEIEELQQENKKYKEVNDKIKHYIEKECRIYGLSMPIDVATHLDNILGILKEVE